MSILVKPLDDKAAKKPVINLFHSPTKAGIAAQKQFIADAVNRGEVSAMEVAVAIKTYQRLIDGDSGKKNGLLDLIQDQLQAEVSEFKNSETEFKGAKFKISEMGTKFDFSHDPVWQGLKFAEEKAAEKRKKHEDLLKSMLPKGKPKEMPSGAADFGMIDNTPTEDAVVLRFINPDTGEEYTPLPPKKTSTTTTVVTLAPL